MRISVFSITSLLISVVAFVLYDILLHGTNVFIPWIILSLLAMFFPLLAKYFRKRKSKNGAKVEIAALIIGAFDFYFVFFAFTKINLFIVFILIGIICFLYVKLFNNIIPVVQKRKTIKIITRNDPITTKNLKDKSNHLPFYYIVTIILSALSILSIIFAMNIQDTTRNIYEPINPTLLYSVLIGINVVFSGVLLFLNKHYILKSFLAFTPAIFSIISLFEGSLFSTGHYNITYIHNELLSVFNTIWVSFSFLILLINIVPLSLKLRSKWYRSVKYREKCYMRVSKMKQYLNDGIISQEEYEKNKEEILMNIEV